MVAVHACSCSLQLTSFNYEMIVTNPSDISFFLMQMIPVAANDVAFSLHAVALTAFTVFQVFIYEVSLLCQ